MDDAPIISQQQQNSSDAQQAQLARYGLSKWIFRRGQDFVKGRILEIGKGEGHVAKYCKREEARVEVLSVNLQDVSFSTTYAHLLETFNLVYVLLNGNELVNSRYAVANSASLLKAGGHIIALIPCHTALYEGLEPGLDDWRSHNRKYVREKLGTHYNLIKVRFFEVTNNPTPVSLPQNGYEEQVRIFERMHATDFAPGGLSILVLMEKK